MKKVFVIFIAVLMAVSIFGCAAKEKSDTLQSTPSNAPASTQPGNTAGDTPETEPTGAEPENGPASQKDSYGHPIEKFFPEAWAGRYVLESDDISVEVYCKACFGIGELADGWLFTVYHDTDGEFIPPEYYEIGTYNGAKLCATCPSDVLYFSNEELNGEYRGMAMEMSGIWDAVGAALREIQKEDLGYSVDDFASISSVDTTVGDVTGYTGVYRLDSSMWTDDSVNDRLGSYHHGFISIAPTGKAFLALGREVKEGTVLIHKDISKLGTDEIAYLFEFDGETYPASIYQLVMTVHGMPQITENINGSASDTQSWTFVFDSTEWWTENPFTSDLG